MTFETTWTADEIVRLKEAWDDGMAAASIGALLGKTRNAVIGKAHRLRLPQHDGAKIKALPHLHLANDARLCQFPIGDPKKKNFRFCHDETKPGSSYCPLHHKKCYQSYIPSGLGKPRWDVRARFAKARVSA